MPDEEALKLAWLTYKWTQALNIGEADIVLMQDIFKAGWNAAMTEAKKHINIPAIPEHLDLPSSFLSEEEKK